MSIQLALVCIARLFPLVPSLMTLSFLCTVVCPQLVFHLLESDMAEHSSAKVKSFYSNQRSERQEKKAVL